MSAKDFALGAGIPQATLSQILNEKQLISVSVINKVIEHYSELVDPYEFLFGTPAPSSDPYEMGLFPSQMVPSAGDKSSDGMREIIRTVLWSSIRTIASRPLGAMTSSIYPAQEPSVVGESKYLCRDFIH